MADAGIDDIDAVVEAARQQFRKRLSKSQQHQFAGPVNDALGMVRTLGRLDFFENDIGGPAVGGMSYFNRLRSRDLFIIVACATRPGHAHLSTISIDLLEDVASTSRDETRADLVTHCAAYLCGSAPRPPSASDDHSVIRMLASLLVHDGRIELLDRLEAMNGASRCLAIVIMPAGAQFDIGTIELALPTGLLGVLAPAGNA